MTSTNQQHQTKVQWIDKKNGYKKVKSSKLFKLIPKLLIILI